IELRFAKGRGGFFPEDTGMGSQYFGADDSLVCKSTSLSHQRGVEETTTTQGRASLSANKRRCGRPMGKIIAMFSFIERMVNANLWI
ncbi:hypothetical protein, partial [Bartonella florencae]|uniref:hypothetical protein n=1 Tax=Bartonella florencae TaxID=928210 RepID=UPI00054D88D1